MIAEKRSRLAIFYMAIVWVQVTGSTLCSEIEAILRRATLIYADI
jgi:hypothetical protein